MQDFAARREMMVDTQVRPNDVTKFPIIEAMLSIPREAFVPANKIEAAYVGENLVVGTGRVILEARTFSKLLDALNIQRTDFVLDIAGGLGYSSAVIAHMAEAVVVVEEGELAALAEAALSGQGVDNAAVIENTLTAGAAAQGPYDVIILEGAIEVLPAAIEAQLKEGGRIGALFLDGNVGVVRIGVKTDGAIAWRDAFNATAPLLPGFTKARAFAL